jgi:hypothetical protein
LPSQRHINSKIEYRKETKINGRWQRGNEMKYVKKAGAGLLTTVILAVL